MKIKQEDYVALHRIVTGLSERTVWQAMVDGKSVHDLLDGIPDELHPWVREVWQGIRDAAGNIYDRAHDAHNLIMASPPPGRREYAEQAKQASPLTPYLFQILDGRDPYPAILKTLRPTGDTRAKTYSEDVA